MESLEDRRLLSCNANSICDLDTFVEVVPREAAQLIGYADQAEEGVSSPVAAGTELPSAPGTPDMRDDSDTAPQGITSGPLKTDNVTKQTSPTFRFAAAASTSGIQGYWWAIDDSTPETGGTWIGKPASGWGSTVDVTPTVAQNGPHTFYVKAVDDSATHNIGPLSGLRFTIDTVAPEVPNLVSPVNDAETVDNTPTLQWDVSVDATSGTYRYLLQVDNFFLDDGHQWLYPDRTVSVRSPTTQWDVDPSLYDGTWNWRASAEDYAGNQGSWSSGNAFAVGADLGPTIGRLHASQPVVLDQNNLRLEAKDVVTPTGSIASVTFYRENNDMEGLQTGATGDELLATDTDPANGWTATVSADKLHYDETTFYAQATDTSDRQSTDGVTAATATSSKYESSLDFAGDVLSQAYDFGNLDLFNPIESRDELGNGTYGTRDVDLYQFTMPWVATLNITVSTYHETWGTSTLNSFLRIFDEDGADLSANANRIALDQEGPQPNSFLEVTLEANTVYYVGVSGLPNRYYDPNSAGQGPESDTTDWYDLRIDVTAPPAGSWDPLISVRAAYDDPTSPGFGQYLIGDPVADLQNEFAVAVLAPQGYSTNEVVFDTNFNRERDAGDYTDSNANDGWTWQCNVSRLTSNDTKLRVWAKSNTDEWTEPVDTAIHTLEVPDWMDPDPKMTQITFETSTREYSIRSLIGTRFGFETPASWPDWLAQRDGDPTWSGIYFGDLVEADYSLAGKVTDEELSSVIGFSIFGYGAPLKYNKGFGTSGSLTIDVYKLFKAAEDLDSLLPDSKEKAKPSKMPTVNPPKVTLVWESSQYLSDVDLSLAGQSTFNIELDARDLLGLPIPPIIVPLTPVPLEFVVTPHFGLGFAFNVGWQWDTVSGFEASNFGAQAYLSAGAAAELQVLGGVFKGGLDATVSGHLGFNATKESDGDWSWQIPVGLGIDLDVVGSAFWGLVSGRFNLVNFSIDTNDLLGGVSASQAAAEVSSPVSTTDEPTIISSTVARSNAGDMAIAWSQVDPGGTAQPLLVQQRRAGDDDWGSVETVTSSDHFRGEPALGYLPDGRLLMLWSESKLNPDDVSKSDLKDVVAEDADEVAAGQEILWSVRGPSGWSSPTLLTANALLDDQPAVVVRPDGSALAVWRHASQQEVADPSAMDLWYSNFDGTAWAAPQEMFNDYKLNGRATLTLLGSGDVLAIWLSSTTLAGKDATIHSSVFHAGSWSAPSTIGEPSEGQRQSPRLFVLPDNRVLAFWTEGTDNGRTMRMAIRDPISGNWGTTADVLPPQEWIGAPNVSVYESRVDVTWHSVDRDNSSVFSVSRDFADDEGNWTVPRELTEAAGEKWWPMAATDAKGNLNVAYVVDPSRTSDGVTASAAASSANIAMLTVKNLPDLAVTSADIALADVPAVSGQANSVRVVVRNGGLADSVASGIALYLGDPATGGSWIGNQSLPPLAVGAETELSFPWTPTEGLHDLWVVIDGALAIEELDEANNAADTVIACVGAPTLQLDPASDTGDPGDGWTVDATPAMTGTTSPDTSVAVYVDSQRSLAAHATTVAGNYTVTLPELANGQHTIWAQAFDRQGNPSPFSQPLSLVVDAVSIPAPGIPSLNPASDTGMLGDGITAIVRPRIDGSARPAATVELYCGAGLQGTAVSDGSGSYTVVPSHDLSGSCEISAVEVDNSGNRSIASAAFTLTVDTTPPQVTSQQVTEPASELSIAFSEDVSTTIAVDDLVLTDESGIRVAPAQMGFTYDPSTHTSTWTFPPLADGRYTAIIEAAGVADEAGNLLDGDGDGIGGDAYSFAFVVGSAPTAPPSGVSASDDVFFDKVQVTWNAVADATAYEVWRNSSNDSATATKVSPQDLAATSYDDTTAVAGTQYWYWVKAVNVAGTSDFSIVDQGRQAQQALPSQEVWALKAIRRIRPDQEFGFTVQYSTSDADNTLSGLGLRIHYDSTLLAFNGFADVLETGLFAQQPQSLDDTSDFDADPSTDEYVLIAWQDISGNWPNLPLPVSLVTPSFTLLPGTSLGTTSTINFSATSSAPSHQFLAKPVVVEAVAVNLDVNGDGVARDEDDGTLIMKYMFGFRDSAIIPSDIVTLLDQAENHSPNCLNPDGSATTIGDALSDGILIRRYLQYPDAAHWKGQDLVQDALIPNDPVPLPPPVDYWETIWDFLDSFNPMAPVFVNTSAFAQGEAVSASLMGALPSEPILIAAGVKSEQSEGEAYSESDLASPTAAQVSFVHGELDMPARAPDALTVVDGSVIGPAVPSEAGTAMAATASADTATSETIPLDTQKRQVVTPDPPTQIVEPGAPVVLDVIYTTEPAQPLLTGLGLRMHYDSSVLTFGSLDELLPSGDGKYQSPADDTDDDFDNDPATDKYVLISWADVDGKWPEMIPVRLYVLQSLSSESAGDTTSINFTASSSAADWSLDATSAVVEFDWTPDAVDDAIQVDKAGATTVLASGAASLLENDTDRDLPNDTLAVDITPLVPPAHGTVTLHSDGTFRYQHDGTDHYKDHFVYRVFDEAGQEDMATVTVSVTGSGVITGYVYADTNRNGHPDQGEGVPKVLISLAGEGISRETWTDHQGWYEFRELSNGSYTIVERQPQALIDGGNNTLSDVQVDFGTSIDQQNFREIGLKPAYVLSRVHATSTMPFDSESWRDVCSQIIVRGEENSGHSPTTPPPVLEQIHQQGSQVVVRGTNANDRFEFTAAESVDGQHRIVLNGAPYEFRASEVDSIRFDGGLGTDTSTLSGSPAADRLDASTNWASMSSDLYEVLVTATEKTFVNGGAGVSTDRAVLIDSFADDVLTAKIDFVQLAAYCYEIELRDFEEVTARSQQGGADQRSVENAIDYLLTTEGSWKEF